MPQIRFNVLKKVQVEKFIGKAKINSFVFYLIKWKSHLNRQISWEPTSIMANMGKTLVKFNQKVKNKALPYVEDQFLSEGLELLLKVSEVEEEQKRKWKVQKVLGKRYINGGIHYFMKWKMRSIFQSDWVSQHGLWRLYPQQLKEFKAQISTFNLPYLDIESFEEFIQVQKTVFLNLPQFQNFSQLINCEKTKKQKLLEKKTIKQEQNIKSQPETRSNSDIIFDLILTLREKFFRPIETMYLKIQQNKAKIEQYQQELTNQQLQQSSAICSTRQKQHSKNLKNQSFDRNSTVFHSFNIDFNECASKQYENKTDGMSFQLKNNKKKNLLKVSDKILEAQNLGLKKILSNENSKFSQEQSQEIESKYLISNINQNYSIKQQKYLNEQFGNKIYNRLSGPLKEVKFQFDDQVSKPFMINDSLIKKSQQLSKINNCDDEPQKFLEKSQIREKIRQQHQNQALKQHPQVELIQQNISLKEKFIVEQNLTETQVIEQQKKQKKVRKIVVIKRKSEVFPQKCTLKKKTVKFKEKMPTKERIVTIRLFAKDISSIQNQQHKQNLYEVIFQRFQEQPQKIQQFVSINEIQEQQKRQNVKERRFLQTSYLKKYHNTEFIEYLQKEIVKIKRQN